MSDILHQSDFLFLKEQMIERQLKGRGIHNEAVLSAMHEIPREEFVSKGLVEYAYKDSALPIEEEQTISQPFIVALMAEALDLEPEDKVLDIGTGSGYAAAVLGRIASEVYTIERHKSLAESARDRFKRLGYDNIHVLHGDGSKGWNEHAPFDAINVAAAGKEVPQPIKDQLAEGGRLVIPVGPAPRSQNLIRLVRKDGIVDRENLGQVRFVPLVSSRGNENAGSTIKESGNQRKTIFTMIEHAAEPVQDIGTVDLDALMDRIGDSRVVLMGEASHGTAEFYDMRARMSKELIEQKGFNIVAVEADWPDAAHIDHYVRGANAEYSGYEPFTRFPVWMWRNEQVLRFINWLKLYNDTQ
ncbi:MAG: protein-L-isoaspartate(D-aspartate) O-methyltransferase, partial [Balneolales bacterium]